MWQSRAKYLWLSDRRPKRNHGRRDSIVRRGLKVSRAPLVAAASTIGLVIGVMTGWTFLLARARSTKTHHPLATFGAPTVRFADTNAKIASDIAQAVDRIAPSLPAETATLRSIPISFDPDNAVRGDYAIFLAGTVIGTPHRGVYLVPERTLAMLRALGIPYNAVDVTSLDRAAAVNGSLHAF
jgi:hypothetical protein